MRRPAGPGMLTAMRRVTLGLAALFVIAGSLENEAAPRLRVFLKV